MWATLNIDEEDRPSSILLTVLACEAFLALDIEGLNGDDEYFRAIVDLIHERLGDDGEVLNPANQKENLNRLSSDATAKLVVELDTLKGVADRALDAQTKADSADVWSEVFHHFFPMPEPEELAKDAGANAIAVYSFDPQVGVIATVGGRQRSGLNRIGPIPRGCSIEFSLDNARDLPVGAEVYWVVRNAGIEAEMENDLGHKRGTGLNARETSAYRGTHFMDVSVKLNGRVIGRRRVPVEISGLGIPLRNPPRKAWTQLRKRKR